MSGIARLWDRLTAPLVNIEDEERRRRVTLLASLALVVMAASELGVVALVLSIPDVGSGTVLTLALSVCLYLVPYFAFRYDRFRLAVGFAMLLASSIVVYGSTQIGGFEGAYSLVLLSNISLFAAAFLSLRAAVVLIVINCALIAIIGYAILGASAATYITVALFVNLLSSTFSQAILHHWRTSVARRERALQASEQRYRAISELSSDYTFYYRQAPDGVVTREWVTEAFERITGYSMRDMPSAYFNALYHPEDLERLHRDRARALAGDMVEGEYRIMHKDGGLRWIHVKRVPEWDAEHQRVTGHHGVVVDITERKQAEEQRLQFAVRQQQFAVVNRLVEAVSHDFRTRLTTVESNRYLIGKLTAQGGPREKIEQRLNSIQEAIMQMSDQLANLATIATLNQTHLAKVDFNRTLGIVHLRFSRAAAARSIALTLEMDDALPVVEADEPKLDVAVGHLVTNALEHTPDGGGVWLRTRHDGDSVILEVEDSGAGIDPDKQPHIFDAFYKTDHARTVAQSGLGLGLTIVKMVAEAHHGRVEVASQVGYGSVFRVYLPRQGAMEVEQPSMRVEA